MTDEQILAVRERLSKLAHEARIPNFAERIKRGGNLRGQAIGAARAAASLLVRNPEEFGVERRYGLLVEEAEILVDSIADEFIGGKLASKDPTEF